jgi:hypothetical protein
LPGECRAARLAATDKADEAEPNCAQEDAGRAGAASSATGWTATTWEDVVRCVEAAGGTASPLEVLHVDVPEHLMRDARVAGPQTHSACLESQDFLAASMETGGATRQDADEGQARRGR